MSNSPADFHKNLCFRNTSQWQFSNSWSLDSFTLRDRWGFWESESLYCVPQWKLKLRQFQNIYCVTLCENISNRFVENQHILQNKNVEGCHCFYTLENLCNAWICKWLDSTICSCIWSTIIYSWWKKKKIYSCIAVWLENRSILIASSDNCGHSSLMLHPHSIKSSFLTITWNLESIISIDKSFICCYILKCMGIPCILKGYFSHAWFCDMMHYSCTKYCFRMFSTSSKLFLHCTIEY